MYEMSLGTHFRRYLVSQKSMELLSENGNLENTPILQRDFVVVFIYSKTCVREPHSRLTLNSG